jgi:AraC family transcriptional regulator of adaptative response/methylated-DNA-[protein]-cysteine methyltransferase
MLEAGTDDDREGDMQMNDYARIERAIRYLDAHFREQPGLEAVARDAELSPFHFQRLFTRWAGISPKRFVEFLTAGYARELLRESAAVLDAAYAAGLSGPGRLHDLIVNVYAVTPGELKARGAGLAIRYGCHGSPFGDCFIAATGKGVCALSFPSEDEAVEAVEELRRQWPNASLAEDRKQAKAVVEAIFAQPRDGGARSLTAVVKGTNFQVKVWEALVRIPPGCAASYEAIAAQVGKPKAVRAVGNAVANNPVAFLIPCHRVIRKTGAFGNYRWGETRKRAILAWEAARAK